MVPQTSLMAASTPSITFTVIPFTSRQSFWLLFGDPEHVHAKSVQKPVCEHCSDAWNSAGGKVLLEVCFLARERHVDYIGYNLLAIGCVIGPSSPDAGPHARAEIPATFARDGDHRRPGG